MDRLTRFSELGLFEASVPRYTSYPTAPHFTDAQGGVQMRRWLGDLGPDRGVSLYIHIPFCERLCWFCACRTQGVRSPKPVAAYLETLKSEIDQVAAAMPGRPRVTTLHWGGGTPTILTPVQIADLAGHLRRAFDVAPDLAFSVEIDPTLVDEDKVEALRVAGMTRASIGIQDFDERIQEAIGRRQSYERTAQVVGMLRAAGIASVNADMVYGLPHQTLEGLSDSTARLLTLRPDRVALYGYAHVPWMAKRQRMIDADTLPDARSRLALSERAESLFVEAGYAAIGIDHFARPGDSMAQAAAAGRLRRNFQGYTDDAADALIGLGASAISRLPQGYAQNAPATAAYTGRVRAGELATTRGYALRIADRVRGDFIERFLCDLSAAPADLAPEYGDFVEVLLPDIEHAVSRYAPWLTWRDGRMTLSHEGKPLARLIASGFDSFLASGQARHSQAI